MTADFALRTMATHKQSSPMCLLTRRRRRRRRRRRGGRWGWGAAALVSGARLDKMPYEIR